RSVAALARPEERIELRPRIAPAGRAARGHDVFLLDPVLVESRGIRRGDEAPPHFGLHGLVGLLRPIDEADFEALRLRVIAGFLQAPAAQAAPFDPGHSVLLLLVPRGRG